MKIDSLKISGIRGINEEVNIALRGKSLLVYGDNGTGKSSLAEALELLFTNGIRNLSTEDTKKVSWRNTFLEDSKDGYVDVILKDGKASTSAGIVLASNSNPKLQGDDVAVQHIHASRNEILFLRHAELMAFIMLGKKDKLDQLQEIIGFTEVRALRALLTKAHNSTLKTLKISQFDSVLATFQETISDRLGATAHSPEELFQLISNLFNSSGIEKTITTAAELEKALKDLTLDGNKKLNTDLDLATQIAESLSIIEKSLLAINGSYAVFSTAANIISEDPELAAAIQILEFLQKGKVVVDEDLCGSNSCPLCLQKKNRDDLLYELGTRIVESEEAKAAKEKADEAADECKKLVHEIKKRFETILSSEVIKEAEWSEVAERLREIDGHFDLMLAEVEKDTLKERVKGSDELLIRSALIEKATLLLKSRRSALESSKEENPSYTVFLKTTDARNALNQYLKSKKKKEVLERQASTLEKLLADFIRRQEEALVQMLDAFSSDFNSCYTAVNPSAGVNNICVVPVSDSATNEMIGVTIKFDFFGEEKVQPRALLSESHLNCFGIAIFLASAKVFNRKNHFVVMDDVISSFDAAHRARFARYVGEKLKDTQVILLTHDKDFFDLVRSEVRQYGWVVHQLAWSHTTGTVLQGRTSGKERIIQKFKTATIEGLGNDIRIYFEKALKQIVLDLKCDVHYLPNDANEKRMPGELLDSIGTRLRKKSRNDLYVKSNIQKILGIPLFIANTTSHDNSFTESFGDLEQAWEDLENFFSLFQCGVCGKNIRDATSDEVRSRIRCECKDETLAYEWK